MRLVPHLVAALVAALAATGTAQAGEGGVPVRIPREIVLLIHDEVPDRSFIEPLVCALERTLTMPVTVRQSSVRLDGLNRYPVLPQLDVDKVMERSRAADLGAVDAGTWTHLVIGRDIGVRPYNYVFAARDGGPPSSVPPLQVVSTARLAGEGGRDPRLVDRLYKIVLRSIVHTIGYGEQGCVLAFPNSLAEHDAKPADLCPADRRLLAEVGLVRAKDKPDCAQLISRLRPAARDPA